MPDMPITLEQRITFLHRLEDVFCEYDACMWSSYMIAKGGQSPDMEGYVYRFHLDSSGDHIASCSPFMCMDDPDIGWYAIESKLGDQERNPDLRGKEHEFLTELRDILAGTGVRLVSTSWQAWWARKDDSFDTVFGKFDISNFHLGNPDDKRHWYTRIYTGDMRIAEHDGIIDANTLRYMRVDLERFFGSQKTVWEKLLAEAEAKKKGVNNA